MNLMKLGVMLVFIGAAAGAQTNTFPTSGNVGIGTTSPQSALQVIGGIGVSYGGAAIKVGQENGGWTNASLNLVTTGWDLGGGAGSDFAEYWTPGNNGRTSPVLTMRSNGNVGIGTTSPLSKLELNGSMKLTSGSGGSITFQDGTIQSTAYTGITCGGDYAESMDVSGNRNRYEPGDVLALDPHHAGGVLKSSEAYSTSVAGIYSTKPGTVGRRQMTPKNDSEVPMAMMGVVPAKVSAENGPIGIGDLLVTASSEGYAMKGTDRGRMLGAVIGKAMGSLESGRGVIEVLVTLQ